MYVVCSDSADVVFSPLVPDHVSVIIGLFSVIEHEFTFCVSHDAAARFPERKSSGFTLNVAETAGGALHDPLAQPKAHADTSSEVQFEYLQRKSEPEQK